MSEVNGHAQPYFIAAIPADVYRGDPSAVLLTLRQLVESSMGAWGSGEVGDLCLVLVPPGAARETSQKIGLALGGTDPMHGIPGMPGGPPV